jgi:hypothetical protein
MAFMMMIKAKVKAQVTEEIILLKQLYQVYGINMLQDIIALV